MNRRLLAILLLLPTLVPVLTWAQQQSVAPGINDHYQAPDFEHWREIFESPRREVFYHREEIVRETDAQPGMVLADIGAGTGLFTLLFSREVGAKGRVIAVDIAPEFIENILRRAEQKGVGNIEGVVNSERDVGLAEATIDRAFICDTYHHFEFPQDTLASIRRALKPDGELVVVDFRKEPGVSSAWVMGHVRTDTRQVIGEIEAAGFRLTEQLDFMRGQYFLRFVKP